MQALLRDYALGPQSNPSFIICQRILHRCHEIIFGDLPPQSTGPYSSLKLTPQLRFVRRKIRPNVGPVMVGVGMVLAGAPALPLLTRVMGEVAIEQGRVEDSSRASRSLSLAEDDVALGTPNQSTAPAEDEEDWKDDSAEVESADQPQLPSSTEDVPQSSRVVAASETMPALPLHMRELRRPRSCDDPFGQLDSLPEYASPPSHSTPSVSSTKPSVNIPITPEMLLQKYDHQARVHLLRSHYCRSEV
jgi:phosphatidylinositol 4-kinase B